MKVRVPFATRGVLMKFAIAFAMLFSLCAIAHAKPVPPPKPRLLGLSHHEFLGLSRENQIAYLKEMRGFVSELAKSGVEVSSFWDGYVPNEKWAFLLNLLGTAEAADNPCAGLEFHVGNSNQRTLCAFQNSKAYCDTQDMVAMAAKCPAEYSAFKANPTYAPTLGSWWSGKYTPLNDADREQLNTRLQGIDPMVAKKVETAPAAPASTAVVPPKVENPAKTADPANMRCIYAGFAIEGGPDVPCKGVSKWVSKDKRGFECPVTRTRKTKIEDPEYKTLAKEKVLCNPVLFGVDKKDEPFCVEPGKEATAKCLKKSQDKKDESMERAVDLAKKNPDAYERMRNTVNYLCEGEANSQAATYIRDTLKLSDSSKQDLKVTCEKYTEAMMEFHKQPNSTIPTSGRR